MGTNNSNKPLLELYVKASGIDNRRIGACIFCQEFWMELYALYELGFVRVEVKTVNINSEAFKQKFLGAQPPIMEEPERGIIYSDNREIEGRIFHLSAEFDVPLFEKDEPTDKVLSDFYRNFKILLQAKANRQKGKIQNLPSHFETTKAKMVDQLSAIDRLLQQRKSRYLTGDNMTQNDCELMPRLHHLRICGQRLLDGFDIPHDLIYLWNYVLTTYRTAAFSESCPADQDIIHHYKEQLHIIADQRESLQEPTKTHTIPEEVLEKIQRLNLQVK